MREKIQFVKSVIIFTSIFVAGIFVYLLLPGDIGYKQVLSYYNNLPNRNTDAISNMLKPDKEDLFNDVNRWAGSGASGFLFPLKARKDNETIQVTHFETYDGHYGVDFHTNGPELKKASSGSDHQSYIIAAHSGTVRIPAIGGLGRHVEINDIRGPSGLVYYYGHMYAVNADLSNGMEIEAGTILGLVGNTGTSRGSHLHYEVQNRALGSTWQQESAIDPITGYARWASTDGKWRNDDLGTFTFQFHESISDYYNYYNKGMTPSGVYTLQEEQVVGYMPNFHVGVAGNHNCAVCAGKNGVAPIPLGGVILKGQKQSTPTNNPTQTTTSDPQSTTTTTTDLPGDVNTDPVVKQAIASPTSGINSLYVDANDTLQYNAVKAANVPSDKYQVLLNGQNSIPSSLSFTQKAVPTNDSKYIINKSGMQGEDKAVDALIPMLNACHTATGTKPIVVSGYRSITDQLSNMQTSYNNNKGSIGKLAAFQNVAAYYAVPGTSEHNAGLAFDIGATSNIVTSGVEDVVTNWLRDHCHEYGFILRYTSSNIDKTGIAPEAWHFRYVGSPATAKAIKDSGKSFEEYVS